MTLAFNDSLATILNHGLVRLFMHCIYFPKKKSLIILMLLLVQPNRSICGEVVAVIVYVQNC